MASKKSATKNTNSSKPAAKAKQGKKNKNVAQPKVAEQEINVSVQADSTKDVMVKGIDAVAKKGVDAVAKKGVDAVATKGIDAVVLKDEASPPSVKESIVPVIKNTAPPAIKPEGTLSVQKTAEPAKSKANLTELNPYLPHIATVIEVIKETHNIVTVRVIIDDKVAMTNFSHKAGQVAQLSIFGIGEATFVINSPPSCKDHLQFSVMRTGEVTSAIHKLSVGDKIGVRGPLGNSFPWESWKGKDIFFIGGGIGMAPIRTIMMQILEHCSDFGKISLLYGARTPNDMSFSYELDTWQSCSDLDCTLAIDAPFEGCCYKVGLIPNVLTELAPDPTKSIAVLCGPPIMIKFTVQALKKLNFSDESIFTTLEKRMKCGIGLCGRCNIGGKYVCLDGPVFSWAELKDLPPEL